MVVSSTTLADNSSCKFVDTTDIVSWPSLADNWAADHLAHFLVPSSVVYQAQSRQHSASIYELIVCVPHLVRYLKLGVHLILVYPMTAKNQAKSTAVKYQRLWSDVVVGCQLLCSPGDIPRRQPMKGRGKADAS